MSEDFYFLDHISFCWILDESYNSYWAILSAQYLDADARIFLLFCTLWWKIKQNGGDKGDKDCVEEWEKHWGEVEKDDWEDWDQYIVEEGEQDATHCTVWNYLIKSLLTFFKEVSILNITFRVILQTVLNIV